jgi:hypothetical protein
MMDTIEEMMSGNSGPMKFDERNWAMAKEPPLTRQTGHTSIPFFHPAMRTHR